MYQITIRPYEWYLASRRWLLSAQAATLLVVLTVPLVGGCPATNPQQNTPVLESVTDITGGLLVVGDMVDALGQHLAQINSILVGDKEAKITIRNDAQLRFQIPQGIKNGQNTLRFQYPVTGAGTAELTDTVTVHRLAAFLGVNNGKLVIADTTDQSVVTTLNVPTFVANTPYIPATANNGSLALVPSTEGVLWVDLTAHPPTSGLLVIAGAIQPMGVIMPPAGNIAAVPDLGTSNVYGIQINESSPPYSNPIATVGDPLALDRPRAGVFFAANRVVIPLQQMNALAILEPQGVTASPTAFIDTTVRIDSGNILGPTEARLSPDGHTLLVPSYGDGQVRLYDVTTLGPGAPSLAFSGNSVKVAGMQTIALDFDPTGQFAYVIDSGSNRIVPIQISNSSMTLLTPGPPPSGTGPESIAVDPVEGKYLYLGQEKAGYVDIYDVAGGTLTLRISNPLSGNTDLSGCKGIVIQP